MLIIVVCGGVEVGVALVDCVAEFVRVAVYEMVCHFYVS